MSETAAGEDCWDIQAAAGHKRAFDGDPDDDADVEHTDSPAGHGRAAKRSRLVWTPELHTRFLNAVQHLVGASYCIAH